VTAAQARQAEGSRSPQPVTATRRRR
jgi:hypothetical protein